jgi:hypothetical protein
MSGKKSRAKTITKKKHQDLWLEAFKRTYTILGACEMIGISRQAVVNWRNGDPDFAKRFEDLTLDIVDRLRNKGLVKAINEGDNDMIKFFLRAHEPETYREKQDIDVTSGGKSLSRMVLVFPEPAT